MGAPASLLLEWFNIGRRGDLSLSGLWLRFTEQASLKLGSLCGWEMEGGGGEGEDGMGGSG